MQSLLLGKPRHKKNGTKKGENVIQGGGVTPSTFFSPNLPEPQIIQKWTMHTDKLTTTCHLCAYLYALWLNLWDLGLAIHDSEGSQ